MRHIKYLIISLATLVLIGFSAQSSFGWHENLGVSDEKAAQLYQTNPSNPQITRWSNALQYQYELNKQVCFEPSMDLGSKAEKEIKESCDVLVPIINENCNHHPNSLLLCSDSRIAAWVQNMNSQSQNQQSEATETTTVYKIPDFYESPTLGIKIWYPIDWQVIDTTGLSFLSRVENSQDNFREAVSVSANLTQGKPLSEIMNGVVNSYKSSLNKFDLIKSDSDTTLANNTAQRLTYSFTDKGNRMKAMDTAVVKGENVYLIQYIAEHNQFENYMPLAQKMIDSFEIIQ